MVDWYAPGFKAGGPIRSAVNFAENLEQDLDIYVLTTDRDLGEKAAYPGILTDRWIRRGDHQVYYLSPSNLRWKTIGIVVRTLNPDYIYLNSMFSRYFTLYPLAMKRLGIAGGHIVLAPRGMLRSSALVHKSLKKQFFFRLFNLLGFSRDVLFHATDETEERDILQKFGKSARKFRAGNLPGRLQDFVPVSGKIRGRLRLVFVGRIHPIKNLEFLLHVLKTVTGEITLTVIATLEDPVYWQRCEAAMAALPATVRVETYLDLPHDQVVQYLRSADAFCLPTCGENFGHAIFEALSAGRPVVISDQTPWRDLPLKKAGWDLPLDDAVSFEDAIQSLVDMDGDEHNTWCRGAWDLASQYLDNAETRRTMLAVFSGQYHHLS
jgi:glycosyltransferase involved in cell wall biosynthesis